MATRTISRRGLLQAGGTAAAGASVLQVSGPAQALGASGGDSVPWLRHGDPRETYPGSPGDDVLLWEDQPPPFPPGQGVGNQQVWEELSTRLTPADDFFYVSHYGHPEIDPATWRLGIDGLVARPGSLSLADIKARPRKQVEFTLECSGNHGFPIFTGGVGNAVWGGAPLARVLRNARPLPSATEVVFWGADSGTVSIRDNSGVVAPPTPGTGTGTPDPENPDVWDITITEHFARSMSLDDAMAAGNLLCYEMNGGPLPVEHGFPVRLIAPGWYGVANVKWLERIELIDQRYAGRFMARDYVTFREHTDAAGKTTWTFKNVGPFRLKSAPAKVTRKVRGSASTYRVIGVAWGGPVARVEVSIDGGPWRRARVVDPDSREGSSSAWNFWTYDWGRATPGHHTVASRAIDAHGEVQPAPDDPVIADRRTYWEANQQITRSIVLP